MIQKTEYNDAVLMNRLATGDMAALGEIVTRYQNKVLAFSYRYLNDWTRAEDITQETFLRVYRAAKHYKPEAKFTTWLYRITVNLCFDEKRKHSRTSVSIEQTEITATVEPKSNSIERQEVIELVKTAINELPERQKLAVVLHRYEGLSHDQICGVTGWSRSAVESLLVRAYANLREKLRKLKNFME